jgi:hypothetical protein
MSAIAQRRTNAPPPGDGEHGMQWGEHGMQWGEHEVRPYARAVVARRNNVSHAQH